MATAIIDGIKVTGTPREIAEIINKTRVIVTGVSTKKQSHFNGGGVTTVQPCGCTSKRVAEGTPAAGTVSTYCKAHNPFENIGPRYKNISYL